MPGHLRRAAKQSAVYSVFQGLGLAVSLVSFPILTRLFSVEEYGNLALLNATVSMLIALAKCGLPTSFVRLYPTVAGSPSNEKRLHSSAFGTSAILGIAIACLYTVGIYAFAQSNDDRVPDIMLYGGVLIVAGQSLDLFIAFLRVRDEVVKLSLLGLISKAGALASGLAICALLVANLDSYLMGVAIFQLALLSVPLTYFIRQHLLTIEMVSRNTILQLLAFGAPLLIYELSSLLNDYADRFLITYFLGTTQLGIYSVGYNLAIYVQGLITAPLWMSVFPIYTRIWEHEGTQKTSEFLERVLQYYLFVAVLITVLFGLVAEEVISILATAKYASAASITSLVIVAIMLHGTTHVVGAPFYLQKKTQSIAMITLASSALNIALNLLLIPSFGIEGAAYATVVSYIFMTLMIVIYGKRILEIKWPIRSLLTYLAAAAIAALIASRMQIDNLVLSAIAKTTIILAVYAGAILTLDHGLRQDLVRLIARRAAQHSVAKRP